MCRLAYFLLLFVGIAPIFGQPTQNLEEQLPGLKDTARVIVLNQLAQDYSRTDTAKSLKYSREALDLSKNLKYHKGVARAIRLQGFAYYFSNDHKKFIEYCEKSTAYAIEHEVWPIVSENYESIAGVYSTIFSNHPLSLEYYLKAYEVYEKHNPNGASYTPLLGIATTYKKQHQLDKTLDYINRAIPLIEKTNDKRSMAIALENMAETYWLQHDLSKSKANYQKSLELFKELESPGGQIFTLTGLANIAREEKDLKLSMDYGKQALAMSEKYAQYDRAKLYGLESVGKTLFALKNYKEAQNYLEEGLEIAKKRNMIESVRDLYLALAAVASANRDFEKAYQYQALYSTYEDSVMTRDMSQQLTVAQTQFDTKIKEAEIEILKRDNQISQFNFIISMASLIGVLIFGYLIITRQRIKNQKDREVAALENERLTEKRALMEAELKNKELSEAQLRDQLAFKNKELTTYTLNLIQKNEAMENIKKQVEEMRLIPENELKQKLTSLINTVNYSFNLDRDWENFKLHFEKVHTGFFERLLKEYPDLNGNDLKLCALMKLNMETKEIASIIDISPESVKVARHRLRKKLNLPTEQNLSSFLAAH